MKKKIIGIFVCTLLIATALPVIGMVEDFEKDIENQQVMTCDGPSNSIWFVRGTFRWKWSIDLLVVWLFSKVCKTILWFFTRDFSSNAWYRNMQAMGLL